MTHATTKFKVLLTFIVTSVVTFAADFLTKQWAISDHFRAWHLVESWVYLTPFQKNEGIAFSLPIPSFVQIFGSLIILLLLIQMGLKYILKHEDKKILRTVFLAMAVGGGLGNLMDRISQGYVVDFMVIRPWPVFNVADVGITVGLIGLFATMLMESKTKK